MSAAPLQSRLLDGDRPRLLGRAYVFYNLAAFPSCQESARLRTARFDLNWLIQTGIRCRVWFGKVQVQAKSKMLSHRDLPFGLLGAMALDILRSKECAAINCCPVHEYN